GTLRRSGRSRRLGDRVSLKSEVSSNSRRSALTSDFELPTCHRQKRYFTPSCTCLAVVTVDVIRPHVGDTSPAALVNAMRPDGTAKFARLNRLKISIRAWIECDRCSGNDLIIDRSKLTSPGPVSVFRPRLPRMPGAGSANALMSQ